MGNKASIDLLEFLLLGTVGVGGYMQLRWRWGRFGSIVEPDSAPSKPRVTI